MLSKLMTVHGAPRYMQSDNSPKFFSRPIFDWIVTSGLHSASSDPSKLWRNRADESLNGNLRDECLSMDWFRSREEAKKIIVIWRRHCNAVRPHSSLRYQTPQRVQGSTETFNPTGRQSLGSTGPKKAGRSGIG